MGSRRTTEKAASSFERPLKVTVRVLAENVDLDDFGFVERLEGHDALNEEWLGIFEVYVEEGHHRHGGEYSLDLPGVSLHRSNA